MAFALSRLVRQLVAHKRPFHLEFPIGCFAETFGGSTFGFELGHDVLEKKQKLPCPPSWRG